MRWARIPQTRREVIDVHGMLRIPRSRGVLSGVLLIMLGAWGALVPFVGPYFHYAYTPDRGWTYTSGRLWLEVLPGAGALIGGLIVLASSYRLAALAGAWLAALSGGWLAVGYVIGPAWSGSSVTPGTPVGGAVVRAIEQLGFFTGLGIAIVFLAALALGRVSVVGVRDARLAARAAKRRAGPSGATAASPARRGRLAIRRKSAPSSPQAGSAADPVRTGSDRG